MDYTFSTVRQDQKSREFLPDMKQVTSPSAYSVLINHRGRNVINEKNDAACDSAIKSPKQRRKFLVAEIRRVTKKGSGSWELMTGRSIRGIVYHRGSVPFTPVCKSRVSRSSDITCTYVCERGSLAISHNLLVGIKVVSREWPRLARPPRSLAFCTRQPE